MSVSAIILAAGESRRMGDANKLLLNINGKPIIRHVVEAVAASSASECIVVLGHEAEMVKSALDGLTVTFVPNSKYAEGMGTSIQAGVSVASPDAHGYMICLSDMPFIQAGEYSDLIKHFRKAFQENKEAITVPVFEGKRGNPVIMSAKYKPDILVLEGHVGCRNIIKKNPAHVTRYPMDLDHVTRDIDTPAAFHAIASNK